MYDDFRKALEDLDKLHGQDRQYAIVWLTTWCLLLFFRYALTALVVYALGRRLIGAFAVALSVAQRRRRLG
ncbi:hypothetical protein BH10PLA1_BH10PLA1_20580 [soil metagenome]